MRSRAVRLAIQRGSFVKQYVENLRGIFIVASLLFSNALATESNGQMSNGAPRGDVRDMSSTRGRSEAFLVIPKLRSHYLTSA
ncbi:unnamed protein product, partial [Iphiclides podalirius]